MKKKVTIEDLAVMTQKGFAETATKLDDFQTEVNERFKKIDDRFDKMDDRFDHIEHLILTDHRNRLERLEDKMRVLETAIMKR